MRDKKDYIIETTRVIMPIDDYTNVIKCNKIRIAAVKEQRAEYMKLGYMSSTIDHEILEEREGNDVLVEFTFVYKPNTNVRIMK